MYMVHIGTSTTDYIHQSPVEILHICITCHCRKWWQTVHTFAILNWLPWKHFQYNEAFASPQYQWRRSDDSVVVFSLWPLPNPLQSPNNGGRTLDGWCRLFGQVAWSWEHLNIIFKDLMHYIIITLHTYKVVKRALSQRTLLLVTFRKRNYPFSFSLFYI